MKACVSKHSDVQLSATKIKLSDLLCIYNVYLEYADRTGFSSSAPIPLNKWVFFFFWFRLKLSGLGLNLNTDMKFMCLFFL